MILERKKSGRYRHSGDRELLVGLNGGGKKTEMNPRRVTRGGRGEIVEYEKNTGRLTLKSQKRHQEKICH